MRCAIASRSWSKAQPERVFLCGMLSAMRLPSITGSPGLEGVFYIAGVIAFLYVLKYAILSRDHLVKVFWRFVIGFIIGIILGGTLKMPQGRSPVGCGVFCGVVAA